jgi:hypothetical protein
VDVVTGETGDVDLDPNLGHVTDLVFDGTHVWAAHSAATRVSRVVPETGVVTMHEVLRDHERVSIRLVLTPERLVERVVRRRRVKGVLLPAALLGRPRLLDGDVDATPPVGAAMAYGPAVKAARRARPTISRPGGNCRRSIGSSRMLRSAANTRPTCRTSCERPMP